MAIRCQMRRRVDIRLILLYQITFTKLAKRKIPHYLRDCFFYKIIGLSPLSLNPDVEIELKR